jgi:pSer/pThr/pTyr-binding forkhead associated (FHA) protein
MTPCPKGCASLDAEWCSECGARIVTGTASPVAAAREAHAPREPCPICGTPRTARFCERCRHDFENASPAPSSQGVGLEAVVTADATAGEPAAPADRVPVFRLQGDELLVGRRSVIRDLYPEIALDDDAGVSHRHAKLVRAADGHWSIVDLGSSNGTELNGTLLVPGARTELGAGDEIRLGLKTVIRIRER